MLLDSEEFPVLLTNTEFRTMIIKPIALAHLSKVGHMCVNSVAILLHHLFGSEVVEGGTKTLLCSPVLVAMITVYFNGQHGMCPVCWTSWRICTQPLAVHALDASAWKAASVCIWTLTRLGPTDTAFCFTSSTAIYSISGVGRGMEISDKVGLLEYYR